MYVTYLCLISRPGSEELIVENIKRNMDNDYIKEIVLIIDNIKISAIKYKMLMEQFNFRNVEVVQTKRRPPSHYTMVQRRNRIADNHNVAKEHIGASDFIFGFEDDTVLHEGYLDRLIQTFIDHQQFDDVGFICGVQVSRWGRPFVGAWLIDDYENPTLYKTILPFKAEVEEIDGGGLYCFLTLTNLYKAHDFKWEEPCGPDVYFGRSLRKKGYINYINWSLLCEHKTNGSIISLRKDSIELEITKKADRWTYTPIKGV